MQRSSFLTAVTAVAVAVALAMPAWAARPKRKTMQVYLSQVYTEAAELEEKGELELAEEKLIQIYNLTRYDRYRTESDWLDYMKSLRSIFAFNMRKANYKDAEWYYKLYAEELEGDHDAEKMLLSLVHDTIKPLEKYMAGHQYERAEDTLLYLNDFLEEDLEYNSYIFEIVFLNLTNLYLEMDLKEKARECADRLSEIRGRETITIE
jgi:hypothetical protein